MRWALVLLFPFCVSGQENPFELAPRLERPAGEALPEEEPSVAIEADTGNPFDLRSAPARPEAARPSPPTPMVEPAVERSPSRYRRIKLFIILAILVLLSFLITVLRSLVNKSFRAIFNDNVMNQLYRDQEGRGLSPFVALYGLFFLNTGVFVFFLLQFFDVVLPLNYLLLLLSCIGAVSGLFLFKHAILRFIAYTFPVEKEVSRYNFNIIVFGIVIGLFLVPVNIFMAYASDESRPFIVWAAIGIIGAIYFFRYLRSLLIANNFIRFHFFHFFLYFCTVELAPALFLFKIVLNQLQ